VLNLKQSTFDRLKNLNYNIEHSTYILSNRIKQFSKDENNDLDDLIYKLRMNVKKQTENQKIYLSLFEKSITLINPINILKRGYSLTLKNGKIISKTNPIKVDDLIETHTETHIFISKITKINE
jgi:exodeoxyribonuclease VII large subunit